MLNYLFSLLYVTGKCHRFLHRKEAKNFELIQALRLFGFILLLTFPDLLSHRQDRSLTIARLRLDLHDQNPYIGFLAFVGPWLPARSES